MRHQVLPALVVPAQIAFDLEFLLLLGGLFLIATLGVWVSLKMRSLVLADESDLPLEQSLDHYQGLLDAGLLAPEEFERIRVKIQSSPSSSPPTTP